MEFDAIRYYVEQELTQRIQFLVERITALEIAHEAEHPRTAEIQMEADMIPVEALDSLPVETPAIVVIDDSESSEKVEALTEQVEALTDAVEVLTSEQVEDAVAETVEDAVKDAVEDLEVETEPVPDETLAIETDDAVVELPIVEQEIKPERRGFLDRKLFGR